MEEPLRISLGKMIIGSKKVEEYVVLINGKKNEEKIRVLFINFATDETLEFFEFNNSQILVDEIPDLFQQKKIKAAILNIFEVKTVDFKNNVEFCKVLRAKFNFFCIPFCFISPFNFYLNKKIIAANAEINVGDSLLMFDIDDNEFDAAELNFTKDGYEYIDLPNIDYFGNEELMKQCLQDVIVAECKPLKIILASEISDLPLMNKIKEIFFTSMPEKLIVLEGFLNEFNPKCSVEISKWIFDKKNNKFLSINKTWRQFCIGNIFGQKTFKIILSTDENMDLPFRKSVIVPYSPFDFFFGYYESDLEDFIVLDEFRLDSNYHEHKISLKIDSNHFPSYMIYGSLNPEIQGLPDKFNANFSSKIPVITFFNNSSFISVNKGHGYEFLKIWNDEFGEQMFISFDEKQPKFGESAIEVFKIKPTTVIFDILSILAKDGKCFESSWGFQIKKNETGEILFEFDNFDGIRQKSFAYFFLSLLIRRQINAIQSEVGQPPSAICFHILVPNDNKEIVMKNFEEACKPLEIDCSFF
uniref:Uncharacterized protein n=1 Tax=Panagrolaimus davidi TaxID=227884 RepID=A0A914QX28_9BILA